MSILRPITPEKEAGLEPVGWSWECEGGMVNCFPSPTSWDYDRPERNRYWADRGFTAPRPLYFQTPLQKAAPELLAALEKIVNRCTAFIEDEMDMRTHSLEVLRDIAGKAIVSTRGDA